MTAKSFPDDKYIEMSMFNYSFPLWVHIVSTVSIEPLHSTTVFCKFEKLTTSHYNIRTYLITFPKCFILSMTIMHNDDIVVHVKILIQWECKIVLEWQTHRDCLDTGMTTANWNIMFWWFHAKISLDGPLNYIHSSFNVVIKVSFNGCL